MGDSRMIELFRVRPQRKFRLKDHDPGWDDIQDIKGLRKEDAKDIALMRAGASTLGELPLAGLPAILVPYPHAWRYQRVNAEYLSAHRAALVLRDQDLESKLLPTVQTLLRSPARLRSMHAAMRFTG